jgi:hypothetical protein
VWATNQVGWAHSQVGGSSGRPDPLIRDGREPGRWGPKGTYVSVGFSEKIILVQPLMSYFSVSPKYLMPYRIELSVF